MWVPPALSALSLLIVGVHSMDTMKTPPQLTAVRLAEIGVQSKAQLVAWQQTTERHEEVALGLESVVSRGEVEAWLEEIGERIEGLERT